MNSENDKLLKLLLKHGSNNLTKTIEIHLPQKNKFCVYIFKSKALCKFYCLL